MHSVSFLAENNKLVHSKMLIRPRSDMFNLRIHVRLCKNREYLQNGSSNPPGKLCNRIFGPFLRRKQLTILLVRADHPKLPLPPPLKLPLWVVRPKSGGCQHPKYHRLRHPCFSQKQLPRKMESRLVIAKCAGYSFWQLFL